MNDDELNPDLPPMAPASTEKEITASPQFLKDCFSSLEKLSQGKIDKNKYMCTTGDPWGIIFRIDFSVSPKEDPRLVNRMICWQPKSGKFNTLFAVGQDIPQLFK